MPSVVHFRVLSAFLLLTKMSQKDKEIHFLRRQILFFSVNLKYYLVSLNLALLDLGPILVPNPKGTAWKKTCTKAKACNSHLIWECLKTSHELQGVGPEMGAETHVHHVAFCEKTSAGPRGFGVSTQPGRGLRQRWGGWTWWTPAWQDTEMGGLKQHLGIGSKGWWV